MDIMTKTCTKCQETKALEEFHKQKTGKHGVRGQCKVCVNAYHKAHDQTPERKAQKKAYRQTPEGKAQKKAENQTPEVKAQQKAYRERNRALVEEYAKATGNDKCTKCGHDGSISRLEWDHIDPRTKLFRVSDYGRKTESLMAEAKKCQRLCSPCHAIKTTENGDRTTGLERTASGRLQ